MYTSYRLKREPIVDEDLAYLWLWCAWGRCASRWHPCSPRTAGTCKVLARRGLELQIGLWTRTASHLISRHPPRVLQLRFDLLAAHFLGNVRYPYPEQANGQRMIGGLIVDCDLNLVGLVNIEVMDFIQPTIIPGGFRATLDAVFHFDVDESFWTTAKATSGRMINIGNCVYAQGQMTAQRLSLARYAQTIICALSVTTSSQFGEAELPSRSSAVSKST